MKIHLDLDSFFISAERIRNPSLQGIPAAVGGRGDPFIFDKTGQSKIETIQGRGAFSPSIFYDAKSSFERYFVEGSKIRGIIITASYEARTYGIKTGMTIREALSIYPDLIVLPPNHLYYHELSHRLKLFLQERIPVVEQYSIDEFFGDVTGWIERDKLESFLYKLQKEIEDRFFLPISIGAAKSKWTAKLATSFAKPHGVKIVDDIESFIQDIPIEEFPGIGRGYLKRLKALHIKSLGETKKIKNIFYSWKKPGIQLYKRIWGEDGEPVLRDSPKKSMGISRTIDPILDRSQIRRRILILARYLAYNLVKLHLYPTTIHLSIKYDFGAKSKAHTKLHRLFSEKLLIETALELLEKADIYPHSAIVRLSLRGSDFYKQQSYDLLNYPIDRKLHRLLDATKKIRQKYGINELRWGVELF